MTKSVKFVKSKGLTEKKFERMCKMFVKTLRAGCGHAIPNSNDNMCSDDRNIIGFCSFGDCPLVKRARGIYSVTRRDNLPAGFFAKMVK